MMRIMGSDDSGQGLPEGDTLTYFIMEAYTHCQSCGMPLDENSVLGTEKDGTRNHVYCRFCYSDGQFTHPGMTLDEMKEHLLKLMKPSDMTEEQMEEHLAGLKYLRRWLDDEEDGAH
ncbi:MAG: zinc ribbon domain-containing protein [Bacteroidetes bacterium]|nr:zinc ribbon domain-containing protein [Bacteroidota bacterium]